MITTSVSTTEPLLKAPETPLHRFKKDLQQLLSDGLKASTPDHDEIKQLQRNLDALSPDKENAGLILAREGLNQALREADHGYRQKLAEAIVEIATQMEIPVMNRVRCPSGSSASRPRYTPDQRKQIIARAVSLIHSHSPQGLSKSELAKELSLSLNQIKRVLIWPELRQQITGVGQSRNRRYVIKTNPQASALGDQ